jgi:O-antigen ligase
VAVYAVRPLGEDMAQALSLERSIWHEDDTRLQWYARNPLMLGSTLTTLSLLALAGWGARGLVERAVALTVALGGIGVVLFGAMARGALVTLLLALPLLWWYSRPVRSGRWVAVTLVTVAAAVLGAGILGRADRMPSAVAGMGDRLHLLWQAAANPLSTADGSVRDRTLMLRDGWTAFVDAPWVGYGQHRRFDAVRQGWTGSPEPTYGHLHNEFLNHAVAAGMPGLGFFLALWLWPAWLAWRRKSSISRDAVFVIGVVAISMAGTALTTAALGHYVHAQFWGVAMTLACLAATQDVHRIRSSSA